MAFFIDFDCVHERDARASLGRGSRARGSHQLGERELSIEAIDKIAKYFGMTIDQIIHYEGDIPIEVKIENKASNEKIQMIEQLEEEDKQAIYRIIDGMLTSQTLKTYFLSF